MLEVITSLISVFAGALFRELLQTLKQAIKNEVSIRQAKHRKKP